MTFVPSPYSFFRDSYIDILITSLIILHILVFKLYSARVVFGVSITLLATMLWIIARTQLGKAYTITPSATQLVTGGLYAYLRHPMYVFSTLSLLGIVVVYDTPLWYALFLAAVLLQAFRARRENAILLKRFGKQYEEYANATWF